jgi:hypothetical protein
LYGRINPAACAVNFEEIDKRLGKGQKNLYSPTRAATSESALRNFERLGKGQETFTARQGPPRAKVH